MQNVTPTADPGIFQLDPHALKSPQPNIEWRSVATRVYHFVKSWILEFGVRILKVALIIKGALCGTPPEYVTPSGENNNWKEDNKGLVVGVHGLFGRPDIWRRQLAVLNKEQPHFEVRLPHVPKRGNCSLDEATAPIEAMVRDYIEKHPGKPVCLMGISRGGPVIHKVEALLRDTNTPIKVSAVAGVLSGTKIVNLLDNLGLAGWVLDSHLTDEIRHTSETATKLMKQMEESTDALRSYRFYATPNDFLIRPFTGSLPFLANKDAEYYLIPGESHNSIASRIAAHQINDCARWINDNQPSSSHSWRNWIPFMKRAG